MENDLVEENNLVEENVLVEENDLVEGDDLVQECDLLHGCLFVQLIVYCLLCIKSKYLTLCLLQFLFFSPGLC